MSTSDRIKRLSEEARLFLSEQLGIRKNHNQLIAFYSTANNDIASLNGALKETVEETLPANYHPQRYIALPEIPRLFNGKIDIEQLIHLHATSTTADKPDSSGIDASVTADKPTELLIEILKNLLGIDDVLPEDNFFEIGGDSITAIRLVSRAREMGIDLNVAAVASANDIASLAATGEFEQPHAVNAVSPFGTAPLTPIQTWFFSTNHPGANQWNISGRYRLQSTVSEQQIRQAINECLQHHKELAVQFHCDDRERYCVYPDEPVPDDLVHGMSIGSITNDSEPAPSALEALTRLARGFDFKTGWLVRFLLLYNDDGQAVQLMWVAHHLVIDHFSVNLLLREIELTVKKQKRQTDRLQHSMRSWAINCDKASNALDESTLLEQYRNHQKCSAQSPVHSTQMATESDVINIGCLLDSDTTSKLLALSSGIQLSMFEVITAAVAFAWKATFDRDTLPIDIEGHGRDMLGDDTDYSNLVGWFSSFQPADITLAELAGHFDTAFCLSVAKILRDERALNKDYFLFAVSAETHYPLLHNNGRVLINYLGLQSGVGDDSAFAPLPLTTRDLRHPGNFREHNVELNAGINAESQLMLDWVISSTVLDNNTLNSFTACCKDALCALAAQPVTDIAVDSNSLLSERFQDSDMNPEDLEDFLSSFES